MVGYLEYLHITLGGALISNFIWLPLPFIGDGVTV